MAKSSSSQRASRQAETPRAPAAVPEPVDEPRARPKEGAGHALRDIVLFAALLGAGLWFYSRHVKTAQSVYAVSKHARDLAEKDTPDDLKKALADLDRALALDSTAGYAVSTHAELDALLWGQFGLPDYRVQAEEFVRRADRAGAPLQEHYAADALVMLYSGKPQQALDFLKDLFSKRTKGGSHLFDVAGRVQRRLGMLAAAKKSFTEAGKDWRTPRFNVDLGQLFFDMNDPGNALSTFERALQANPDHPGALIGRARAAIAKGEKVSLATSDLASLLGPRKTELSPTLLAQAYTARAELSLATGQSPAAVADARAAIAADASYAPGYEALGLSLTHDPATKGQAQGMFDKALALDPYVLDFYFAAAKALVAAGLGDAGVAMMNRLDKSLPRDENYFLIFGDLLHKKGDQAGALAQYDQAIKLNPFSAQAWYAKGNVLQLQKNFPDAGKAYDAALGAQQNFPEVHQQLGYMLLENKKPADAAAEFEEALEQWVMNGAPHDKIVSHRDQFVKLLAKAPPKLRKKFAEDLKQIVH